MKFFENIFQAILSLFGRSNKNNNTDTSASITGGVSPADYTNDTQQSNQGSGQNYASDNPGAAGSFQSSQNVAAAAQPIQPNMVAPATGVASAANASAQDTPTYNGFPEPTPGAYTGFPDTPEPNTPTYGGFPTYDGFPSTDTPTYGGFPVEDTPTYGGFPPAGDDPTYGGFPGGGTYDGFPVDTPTYGGFPTYAGFPPSSDYGFASTTSFEIKADGTYVGIMDDAKEPQGGWGSPAADAPADPTNGVIAVDNNKDTDPLSVKDDKHQSNG